jgi:hypothetical protein
VAVTTGRYDDTDLAEADAVIGSLDELNSALADLS